MEILELLQQSVRDYNQTLVMVTHDPRAAAIADRALFLADGRIVKDLGCATCHNASTRSLAGIRSRIASTIDLQQRMLFPMQGGRGRGGRGRGAPGAPAAPNPNAVTVTVTPRSGPNVPMRSVPRSRRTVSPQTARTSSRRST